MSLLHFHRFLIVTGILFCGGYAGRELAVALREGGVGSFALAAVFTVLAAALTVYLVHLRRFLGYEEGDAGSP